MCDCDAKDISYQVWFQSKLKCPWSKNSFELFELGTAFKDYWIFKVWKLVGRPKSVKIPEAIVAASIEQSPSRSARNHASVLGTSNRTVRQILHCNLKIHPHKILYPLNFVPNSKKFSDHFIYIQTKPITKCPQRCSHTLIVFVKCLNKKNHVVYLTMELYV